MTFQKTIEITTRRRGTQNITDAVNAVVRESGIVTGLAHLFVQHTSCALTITENADPDVRRDLETVLARLAPDGDAAYQHDLEGPDDMAAHARSVLTGIELSIPIGDAGLLLGTWQGIYLWEHRAQGSVRRLVVTLIGS